MQTYPLNALDSAQTLQQLRQTTLAVEVDAVVGGILCDDHQLLHATSRQLSCLLLDLLHRYGCVLATNKRNGTVAAEPVATLGNLQVGVV